MDEQTILENIYPALFDSESISFALAGKIQGTPGPTATDR